MTRACTFLFTCLFAPLLLITATLQLLSPWTLYLPNRMLLADSLTLIFTMTLLIAVVRFIEKDRLDDYGLSGVQALPEFFSGALVGTGMVSVVTAILFFCGCYHIQAVENHNDFLAMIPALLVAAFLEEVIFRGYIFRVLEKATNANWALILSALMFGAVHILNFKGGEPLLMKLISCTVLGLDAGLLFGCAFLLKRRLWFPLGIHTCWNLFEGPFYGTRISGLSLGKSFLISTTNGPDFLTGGIFGPEASVIELVICLILSYLLYRAYKLKPEQPSQIS